MHHTITLNSIVYLKKAWFTCFFSHFHACTGTYSLLGQLSRLSQVNKYSPRANVFPAVVANFGKAMYRSLERSTQDTRDGFFCTVPRPHFLGRALIWSGYVGEHILGLLDYILRVCQSLRDLFFYLGKLHWFLYLLLSYYYDPGMFIFCWTSNFVKKLCWMRAWRPRWHLVSPTL